MRKGFLIVLAVVLVAALSAPAMAGTDINGFYRAKAYMSNFFVTGSATGGNPIIAADAPTSAFIEQRLRLKFSSGEENVKAVVQFEIDFSAWGDAAGGTKNDGIYGTGSVTTGATTGTGAFGGAVQVPGTGAGRNSGGALGADRINLETKNVYLWFKLPNTSLDFTVGMQTVTDAYAGLIYGGADMAGIFMNGKYEPVSYTLGYAKLYENATQKSDDTNMYVASVKFVPNKDSKVGVNLYYLTIDGNKSSAVTALNPVGNLPTDPGAGTVANPGFFSRKIWTPGVDFAVNTGKATISGFAIYQFGTYQEFVTGGLNATSFPVTGGATGDVDVSGYAIDLRGDMNLGPGKFFIEGIYVSGGDNVSKEFESVTTLSDFNASPGGNSAFSRTGMNILMNNADAINCAQSLIGSSGTPAAGGFTSPSNAGRGITHIAAGYKMPLAKQVTGTANLGWLQASNMLKADQSGGSTGSSLSSTRKGKTMGTEINAAVDYNIMKGLDVGVAGAFAWLGDFYKSQNGSISDPDNPYELHMRLNYAF